LKFFKLPISIRDLVGDLRKNVDINSALLIAVCVLILLSILQQLRSPSLRGRADRVEQKVDAILKHLGIEWKDQVSERVKELVRAGKKIEAIKMYREETGAGLKEAKDAVEAFE
jgi:ribosomal protein L7/L12